MTRVLRYLHHRSGVLKNLKKYWLGDWKNNLEKYDEILIEDSIFDYTPLEFIRSITPQSRLVCCFRNRVKAPISHCVILRHPKKLRKQFGCELWTYNQEDCDKYSMIKYNQFHLIPEEIIAKNLPIIYDTYFIGKDKQRIGKLMELKKKMDSIGLTSKIEVIADSNRLYSEEEKLLLVPPISYDEVLYNVLQSRCVIDIVVDVNYGMTYRCLEAAVLGKKLITNYAKIKEADFYNRNNIFIWGIDCEAELKEFVLLPFDDSVMDGLEVHSFQYFCKQIFSSLK